VVALGHVALCVAFADRIGLRVRLARPSRRIWRHEFLPGICVWRGAVYVRADRVKCYSDVLHEMAHLAILPSCIRRHATGDVDRSIHKAAEAYRMTHLLMTGFREDPVQRALMQAGECEAIAWSYAAMIELGLRPRMILAGGGTTPVFLMLKHGQFMGVNGLQAAGMTTVKTFPQMLRWVQP
jgi:hypothetical protein